MRSVGVSVLLLGAVACGSQARPGLDPEIAWARSRIGVE